MIRPEFLTYQDAANHLGSPESLRQTILAHGLPAYLKLDSAMATSLDDAGDRLAPGETTFSTWERHEDWFDVAEWVADYGEMTEGYEPSDEAHDGWDRTVTYTLTGWFLLPPTYTRHVALDHPVAYREAARVAAAASDEPERGDKSMGRGATHWFSVHASAALKDLWFRYKDVDRLLLGGPSDERGVDGPTALTDSRAGRDARQDNHKPPKRVVEGRPNRARRETSPAEYEPYTYLPVIQVLAVSAAKTTHGGLAEEVAKKVEYFRLGKPGLEVIKAILKDASVYNSALDRKLRKSKESPYKYERSLYLAVIKALAVMCGHRGRGGAASVDTDMKELHYGPGMRTVGKILAAARELDVGGATANPQQ